MRQAALEVDWIDTRMEKKDYYGILGVSKEADESEIKMAYRRLALRNHPDTNRDDPRAEDRFKEINEAYEVLSHKDKRNQYDLGGNPLFRGSPFHSSFFDPYESSLFAGLRCRGGGFGRAFGRKGRVSQKVEARPAGFGPYASDLPIHDLPLTSHEALEGTERDIRLHTGRDTLVFTVSIPAGVENGALFSLKRAVADDQEIELRFRVRIAG